MNSLDRQITGVDHAKRVLALLPESTDDTLILADRMMLGLIVSRDQLPREPVYITESTMRIVDRANQKMKDLAIPSIPRETFTEKIADKVIGIAKVLFFIIAFLVALSLLGGFLRSCGISPDTLRISR